MLWLLVEGQEYTKSFYGEGKAKLSFKALFQLF